MLSDWRDEIKDKPVGTDLISDQYQTIGSVHGGRGFGSLGFSRCGAAPAGRAKSTREVVPASSEGYTRGDSYRPKLFSQTHYPVNSTNILTKEDFK